MRFQTPPNWPPAPENWIPDPGWKPEPSWPTPPLGWRFWVNDYGVPIAAPAGLFGAETGRMGKVTKLKGSWLVGSAAAFIALLLGVGIGSTGSNGETVDARAASLTSSARNAATTVTSTVTAPAVTTTETLPASTVTATVTSVKTVKAVKTVRSTKTVSAGTPQALSGGGGSAVYYANCTAARAAGVTPLYRGQPGYASHLDRDGDGVACE